MGPRTDSVSTNTFQLDVAPLGHSKSKYICTGTVSRSLGHVVQLPLLGPEGGCIALHGVVYLWRWVDHTARYATSFQSRLTLLGAILDLDLECKRSLEPLRRFDFVAPAAHPAGFSIGMMMASVHHPFLKSIIDNLPSFNRRWGLIPYATVMFSTGCHFASYVSPWQRSVGSKYTYGVHTDRMVQDNFHHTNKQKCNSYSIRDTPRSKYAYAERGCGYSALPTSRVLLVAWSRCGLFPGAKWESHPLHPGNGDIDTHSARECVLTTVSWHHERKGNTCDEVEQLILVTFDNDTNNSPTSYTLPKVR